MREPADIEVPTESSPKLKVVHRARGAFDIRNLVRENWRLLTVLTTLALGVTFVLLGWYGASHTNIVSEQIPYLISGGLLGLGLIIVAGFMAYSFMNSQTTEDFRRDIVDALGAPGASTQNGSPGAHAAGGTVYVVAGGKGYHLAGCPIIESKQGVREMRLIQAVDGGYVACKLCSPD